MPRIEDVFGKTFGSSPDPDIDPDPHSNPGSNNNNNGSNGNGDAREGRQGKAGVRPYVVYKYSKDIPLAEEILLGYKSTFLQIIDGERLLAKGGQ
jgi:hypothetical protein